MQVPMKADAMVIDSQRWRSAVIDGARELGLSVTDRQVRQMQAHAMDLLQWNRTTNLTAITDPRDMAVKHYLDALAPAPWIGKAARLLDAGAGGGFPGIPLKIIRPDLAVTLVDSVRKKVSFLKHAIRTLELADTVAVHGRLEQLGNHADFRGQYDVVVCRAFSSLADLTDMTMVGPCGWASDVLSCRSTAIACLFRIPSGVWSGSRRFLRTEVGGRRTEYGFLRLPSSDYLSARA
jgi:16S rRNA (guanine527-N7)-methyltransferase